LMRSGEHRVKLQGRSNAILQQPGGLVSFNPLLDCCFALT
jgi:hypothetical protein